MVDTIFARTILPLLRLGIVYPGNITGRQVFRPLISRMQEIPSRLLALRYTKVANC